MITVKLNDVAYLSRITTIDRYGKEKCGPLIHTFTKSMANVYRDEFEAMKDVQTFKNWVKKEFKFELIKG